MTLGAYVLNPKNQARFIVIDADDNQQFAALAFMATKLASDNVPSYLESSRRGGHLWLFFDEPISGSKARAFGKGVINTFGLPDIELFPKQSRLKSGPGSLIRLPFGVHRMSGERYGFIRSDGQPLATTLTEQIQLLSAPRTVPVAAIEAYKSKRNKASQPSQKSNTSLYEEASGTLSQRIKGSATVVEFVSQYVELGPNGRGLCPFHDDLHSSFSVNADRNYWHCFAGCGGGSIIDFWMKRQGIDFTTAVRELSKILL